ncbi:hypothetical protein GRAN_4052 [Granulicella sibirica]|uniref:Uncharacterized protein n=1 Tax=Granulicella sibirica TaxID=2479048 RepID=A0A4Q0SZ89_9BACT|nr:hypothetical protein GRAN_4052 [Granulicella sibirica]
MGSPVLAKSRFDWSYPACPLPSGALITGHISAIQQRTKQNKGTSFTILFDHANCHGNGPAEVRFRIFAMIGEQRVDEGSPLLDRAGLFGSISPRAPLTMGGGRTAPAPPPYDPSQDMSQSNRRKRELPTVILAGMVFGLDKITLDPGDGQDDGSVITDPKNNLHIDGATQLVLMPVPAVVRAAPEMMAKGAGTPAPTKLTPPPTVVVAPALPDETEVCAASCTVVAPPARSEIAKAALMFPAGTLGFVPHDRREYTAFDYESTLTFIDEHNLLFTFDSHKLRQRLPAGFRGESMRQIRAVLLDPATLAVKKIREWQVQGDGRFLWRSGSNEILVHIGHQLRLLDANLDTIRSIDVPGELAFATLSPLGERIAIGTLHERYTRESHDQLYNTLGYEPEEDIDVQLFDRSFTLLLTARQTTSIPIPVLSDDGEIRVVPAGHDRWRITDYLWDRSERTIATTTSTCHPTVSAPLPGSLFLKGCTSQPLQNWYRMLRLDGHPILKARGSSQELEQSSSSSNGSQFAIRVVRALHSKARGDRFHKEDLHEQEISIYRIADGKRLFNTVDPSVSLAEQSFALSPDGQRLAVLSNANISLYATSSDVH